MSLLRPTSLLNIAQRFNAGSRGTSIEQVPIGTKGRFCRPDRDSVWIWLRYPALKRWAILISFPSGFCIAAQNFHEIAPPVDYSFIPTWLIFGASFIWLSLIGFVIWFLKRKGKPALPPK